MFDSIILQLEDFFSGRPAFGDFGSRSSQWRKVRSHWLKDNPFCAVCGYDKDLNVHHIKPFHLFPELELDPHNFITLGESCTTGNHHLLFGHLGDWHSYNTEVVCMSIQIRFAIQNRPKRERKDQRQKESSLLRRIWNSLKSRG